MIPITVVTDQQTFCGNMSYVCVIGQEEVPALLDIHCPHSLIYQISVYIFSSTGSPIVSFIQNAH